MAACEKCWSDAYFLAQSDPGKSQSEHYAELLELRKDNPCVQKSKMTAKEFNEKFWQENDPIETPIWKAMEAYHKYATIK